MNLTLKIRLLPSEAQAELLLQTMIEANHVCNEISKVAWDDKVFNQFKLHSKVYHPYKTKYRLSAQMLVRCISKVSDSYKLDKKRKHSFRKTGGITYDSRILTYPTNNSASIWCIGGRQTIPFICHNEKYLPFIKGEADLIYKNNKFYLFQSVNVNDEEIMDVEEFIGCDFGLTDIVVTSDGVKHSANTINKYREHRQKIRSSIQRKGTRNAKRLLKRLSGKEGITATIINHTIAKSIVASALASGKGIALEDLTNISFASKRRVKAFRTKLGNWSFKQLRSFIEYKALISGVPVVIINPAYTSKTCSVCHHIGNRNNKSFKCLNCNHSEDADINASKNIGLLGAAINQPEKSILYSCSVLYSDLKSKDIL